VHRLILTRFLVLLAQPHGNSARFRANIKADSAAGASGTGISDRIVALTIQEAALRQNTRGAGCDAQTAALAEVGGDLDISPIRVAHDLLQTIAFDPAAA